MRPNIILVLSDQQRWDTLGYGGIWPGLTPNLDSIGEDGTLFENCFSVQPVCGPARACLQSGRFATETGNYKNGVTLPPDCDTIGKYVRDAGYDTAYIGKWHIYKDHFGDKLLGKYDVPVENRMGYDFWQASNALEFTSHAYDGYLFDTDNRKIEVQGYRADFITQLAVRYLENHSADKPFFLTISYLEPHQQNDLKQFTGPEGSKEKYAGCAVPEDLKGLKGDYAESLPDYLGMCENLDVNVGKLRDILEKKGLWENTVFLYSADHGCHFRTRNGEYKRSCHEASIHVPLIAHGPGFNGRGHVSSLTTLLDIPASILHAAQVSQPDSYRGHPLQKDVFQPQDQIFVQISEDIIGRCVRTDRWKYCVAFDDGVSGFEKPASEIYYEAFLYDLKEDPEEHHNLVDDPEYQAIRDSLRASLLEWIRKVENAKPQILPASENKEGNKQYSFRMTLQEMLEDEKTRKVIEQTMPILIKNKYVALGANMKFYFIKRYAQHVPFVRAKIRKLEKRIDALNEQ
ncbi:MAG: sulfatase-like hydrolase/transferase [Faecousia sp.]